MRMLQKLSIIIRIRVIVNFRICIGIIVFTNHIRVPVCIDHKPAPVPTGSFAEPCLFFAGAGLDSDTFFVVDFDILVQYII